MRVNKGQWGKVITQIRFSVFIGRPKSYNRNNADIGKLEQQGEWYPYSYNRH